MFWTSLPSAPGAQLLLLYLPFSCISPPYMGFCFLLFHAALCSFIQWNLVSFVDLDRNMEMKNNWFFRWFLPWKNFNLLAGTCTPTPTPDTHTSPKLWMAQGQFSLRESRSYLWRQDLASPPQDVRLVTQALGSWGFLGDRSHEASCMLSNAYFCLRPGLIVKLINSYSRVRVCLLNILLYRTKRKLNIGTNPCSP